MSDPGEEEGSAMTFWEHLAELRSRILKAAVAFLLGAGVAWFYKEQLLTWLVTPLVEGWDTAGLSEKPAIHSSSPAEAFIAYVKLSLMAGFAMALPMIFYQLWAFIAPGLYSREKRFALPFVVASTGLFVGGGYFGWKIAFPTAFGYLLTYSRDIAIIDFQATLMIGEYIQFVSQMLLAFGVVFELPVLVFFLAVAGIVDHTHLIRFFRYFVVLAFVLGAVLTPPDIMSQFLLAGPLVLLYVLSIGIAWVVRRGKNKKNDTDQKNDD